MKRKSEFKIRAIVVFLGIFVATASANAQRCPGIPTLEIGAHTLDFSESQPICVRSNGIFKIQLVPENYYPIDYNKVTVKQKRGWKKIKMKDINAQGLMRVKVGDFQYGDDPAYKIKVKDVGVLDPRVRIIHSYLALNRDYEEIEDHLLEEYGLSFSGLNEIDAYLQGEFGTTISEILVDVRNENKRREDEMEK